MKDLNKNIKIDTNNPFKVEATTSWFKDLFQIESMEHLHAICMENGVDISNKNNFAYEDAHFVFLNYNMFNVKGNNYFARFCRGLILDSSNMNVVCRPFNRFFNYGEQNTHLLLDHAIEVKKNIQVFEKLDGSIIKLFFNPYTNNWSLATNGTSADNPTVEAFNLHPVNVNKTVNFKHLFIASIAGLGTSFLSFNYDYNEYFEELLQQFCLDENLNKEFTYIFELCTPFNKVVVQHSDLKVHFLSALRNKLPINGQNSLKVFDLASVYESNDNDAILKIQLDNLANELSAGMDGIHVLFKNENIHYPKNYSKNISFNNSNEILNTVEEMDGSENEGFVIYIDNIPKVKIKSSEYLALHHKLNNNIFTIKNAVNIVMDGEEDEYIAILPERKDLLQPFIEAREQTKALCLNVYHSILDEVKIEPNTFNLDKETKKNLFFTIKKLCAENNANYISFIIEAMVKGKSLDEVIQTMSIDKKVKLLTSTMVNNHVNPFQFEIRNNSSAEPQKIT